MVSLRRGKGVKKFWPSKEKWQQHSERARRLL